jgi:oligoribonuclease NrnB/cAMP/cGMP phosphodiesterase (DHH superfamily)
VSDKPLVIYHFPCHDGFTAAYAAWLHFKNEAEYFPTNYDKAAPDVTDRDVFIVDFSFKREKMQEIFSKAKRVVWLDHHKTAFEEWLGELPIDGYFEERHENYIIRLDNSKSGARLAWEFFHPNKVVPPYLVQHVEDRDLWKFSNQRTRAFCQNLATYEYEFEQWHLLANMNEAAYNQFVHEGQTMLRQFEQQVKGVLRSTKRPCAINKLFKGLAANVPPVFQSEAGHLLAVESGTFGLLWSMNSRGIINCSLRSNGDYDVSKLAKIFGGGGHRNAAGFQLQSLRELEKFFE